MTVAGSDIRIVTLDHIAGPLTIAELDAATDIGCAAFGGIGVDRTDVTVERTSWGRPSTRPRTWSTTLTLTGAIPRQCDACCIDGVCDDCAQTLWVASSHFGCPADIVIRRGCPSDAPWAAGQEVEHLSGRWGVRNPLAAAEGAATFSVVFYADTDRWERVAPDDAVPLGAVLCMAGGCGHLCDDNWNCLIVNSA